MLNDNTILLFVIRESDFTQKLIISIDSGVARVISGFDDFEAVVFEAFHFGLELSCVVCCKVKPAFTKFFIFKPTIFQLEQPDKQCLVSAFDGSFVGVKMVGENGSGPSGWLVSTVMVATAETGAAEYGSTDKEKEANRDAHSKTNGGNVLGERGFYRGGEHIELFIVLWILRKSKGWFLVFDFVAGSLDRLLPLLQSCRILHFLSSKKQFRNQEDQEEPRKNNHLKE